jgi:hypothetical protein
VAALPLDSVSASSWSLAIAIPMLVIANNGTAAYAVIGGAPFSAWR